MKKGEPVNLGMCWAHVWAFGLSKIVVGKSFIDFQYKIPYFQNGWQGPISSGFVHRWKKGKDGIEYLPSDSKVTYIMTLKCWNIYGWQSGIFNPKHPTPTEAEYKRLNKTLADIRKLANEIDLETLISQDKSWHPENADKLNPEYREYHEATIKGKRYSFTYCYNWGVENIEELHP